MIKPNSIRFSVVVPLYNKAPHISETIHSILKQTYSEFEIIVVNDASTDNSREIVSSIVDKRLKIIDRSVPGPGGYAARNRGIREARFEYVALLDADDLWIPDFLENMVETIEKYPSSGFYSSGWIEKSATFGEKINSYSRKFRELGIHQINLAEFLNRYIQNVGPVCSSVAVIKKSLMNKAGGFPEDKCQFGGDIDTWFRIMLAGHSLTITPLPLAVYNKEAVNMVTKANKFNIAESCVRITTEELDFNKFPVPEKLIKKFVNHFQFLTIRRKAMAANLTPKDLRYIYKSVNVFTFSLFKLYSHLPAIFQKFIVWFYKSLK